MFFTQEDYRKIEKWLQLRTLRDTDFPSTDFLRGTEWIPIIQNGKNKTIAVNEFIKQVAIMKLPDLLNNTKDSVINNIADLIDFLKGFTDDDTLKGSLDALKNDLESQISIVNEAISNRVTTLEILVRTTLETLHGIIDTINTRLDNHDTSISTLNNSLASHISEYNLLVTGYKAFRTEVKDKFVTVDNEISKVNTLLESKFTDTLVVINQLREEINNEINDIRGSVGSSNGIAPLDGDAKIPAAYLPSYVDDVIEYPTKGAFPIQGESGKIYVACDTNLTYRWSGTTFIEISKSLGLGETETTAYSGAKGKKNANDIAAHKANTNNPHNVTKGQIGLGNVDNTSDKDKPVSDAAKALFNTKVDKEEGKGLSTNDFTNNYKDILDNPWGETIE